MNPNILAAIVGGLIGIFSSLLINVFYNGHQNKVKFYKNYLGWSNGIKAEINHLLKVLDEIEVILRKGVPSTKRFNHDYLEQSRIKLIEFENDLTYMELLTNAYRDVVHTNDMLNRLESYFEKGPESKNTILHLTCCIASIDGMRTSILRFNLELARKLKNMKKPKFWEFY